MFWWLSRASYRVAVVLSDFPLVRTMARLGTDWRSPPDPSYISVLNIFMAEAVSRDPPGRLLLPNSSTMSNSLKAVMLLLGFRLNSKRLELLIVIQATWLWSRFRPTFRWRTVSERNVWMFSQSVSVTVDDKSVMKVTSRGSKHPRKQRKHAQRWCSRACAISAATHVGHRQSEGLYTYQCYSSLNGVIHAGDAGAG